ADARTCTTSHRGPRSGARDRSRTRSGARSSDSGRCTHRPGPDRVVPPSTDPFGAVPSVGARLTDTAFEAPRPAEDVEVTVQRMHFAISAGAFSTDATESAGVRSMGSSRKDRASGHLTVSTHPSGGRTT